jgi:LPS export ABC transporter protein LptC
MQLTRTQSRILAFGFLAIFFALALVLSSRSKNGMQGGGAPPPDLPQEPASAAPEQQSSGSVLLKEFHRSETKDGKTVWEVTSARGQFYPQTNSVRVEEAVVHLYRKDGAVIEVHAAVALLEMEGAVLKKVNASGGVKLIYNNELTMDTDSAVFDQQTNMFFAPGLVKINSDMLETTGTGMTADLNTRSARLERDVHSIVKAREETHVAKKK